MKHYLTWTVGHSPSPDETPAEFVPATVPGAVQLDWARAHNWPDHNVGDNFKAYAWMEDVYWHYRAKLPELDLSGDRRVIFKSKGIDYRFEIRFGGVAIHEQEGMFRHVDLDITQEYASGAEIEIVVWPAPKSVTEPVDRVQANRSCKPAVSYEWDFHPRLIPLGIWDETYVDLCHRLDPQLVGVMAELSDNLQTADVSLWAAYPGLMDHEQRRYRWTLTDPIGSVVFDVEGNSDPDLFRKITVDSPRLWWPHAEGDQPLYTSTFTLLDESGAVIAERTQRIGFRRVRLVMHPTAWDEPADFPKTRSTPPITLEINGRRIFAKGSNWAPCDIFPGQITRERYAELLGLFKAANLSIVRCWGGAIVNKDDFFDLCDELGIMVWQEFPLACNAYPDDPDYLQVLDDESRAIIERLQTHPCLTIWCGGNELFNSWSGMTDQSHSLRLLNSQCYRLDPDTPFLPTSPVMGMGHGPYLFRSWEGVELFESMPKTHNTAYTEFATAGPADVETLRRIVPPGEFWPPKRGTAWQSHHGFGAWGPETSTWLMLDVLEDYFGPVDTVEKMVEWGQWLQCEGLKCIFETARRKKPYASMALNWCFNEPWPCVANNSIVSWPANPKPGYHAVAAACRPTLASAQISKFVWTEGDLFAPELWLLHDGPEPAPPAKIEASVTIGGREYPLLAWDFPGAPANTNAVGPIVRFPLPEGEAGRMTLHLRVAGYPEWGSRYDLLYRPAQKTAAADSGARVLNQ